MSKEYIKDKNFKIIGSIETDANGVKIVRNFYGKLLGKYDPKTNLTKDFYGKVVARGDATGLLFK